MQRKKTQSVPVTLKSFSDFDDDDEKSTNRCKMLRFLIFTIPCLIILLAVSAISHKYYFLDQQNFAQERKCPKRGFVTCAPSHLLLKVETLRRYMHEHLMDSPDIQVFHSGEIDKRSENLYPNLHFVDLR